MKQLTVLVALAGALAGCGPVRSTRDILDAEVQIQAARTAEAEKLAPYQWTAANLYLHKAREAVSYSDYESGVEFAAKASVCANEAREEAMKAAGSEVSSSDSNPDKDRCLKAPSPSGSAPR